MTSLAEIESAAKQLPASEQRKLMRLLAANMQTVDLRGDDARGHRIGADYLLTASAGAPAMTQELVKQLLEE